MDTLKLLKKNIYTIISIMILVSFIAIPFLYSDDSNNRYRDDSSSVFSPGYLNAAKYQAEAIVAQQTQPKSMLQNIIDYVQGNTENKIREDAVDEPTPVLQQKQSSKNSGKASLVKAPSLIDSTQYNVTIDNTWADLGGGIKSKVVNGVTNMFVDGSGGIASIQNAITLSNQDGGGIVLVEEGNYSGNLDLSNGVRLLGGYNAFGNRNIDANVTTINGIITVNTTISDPTEINGFNITSGRDINGVLESNAIILDGTNAEISDQLTILNNSISATMTCIYSENTSAVIYNNNIYGELTSTAVWGDVQTGGTKKHPIYTYEIIGTTQSYQTTDIESDASQLTIMNNIFSQSNLGISETNSSSTISGNFFWGIGFSGIITSQASNSVIYGNTFYGTNSGIGSELYDTNLVTNNIFYNTSNPLIIGTNSYFYGDNNIFYSGSIVYLDPSTGEYTSSIWADAGYSPASSDTPYGKITSFSSGTSGANLDNPVFANPEINPLALSDLNNTDYVLSGVNNITGAGGNASSTLGTLLKNNGILTQLTSSPTFEISGNKSRESFDQSALLVPKYVSSADVDTAMRLADILKNPTDDQKTIIDTIKALLGDTDKLEKDLGKQSNPEITKAQNDLLNAVANMLLAQGIPDLFSKGSSSNIKAIFSELGVFQRV